MKTHMPNIYEQAYRTVVSRPDGTDKLDMDYVVRVQESRRRLVKEYAWAIPNRTAIDLIAEHSPIIELGAGTGYWANLVTIRGGRVEAYDKFPSRNEYKFEKRHYKIQEGDEAVLESYDSSYTLLLCWPCYDTPFAFNALSRFTGNTLIYVGEGHGGCCGDNLFHETLDNCWDLTHRVEIPRWPFIHDSVYMYRRKKNEILD
jgi:hypothetical protein